MPIRYNRAARRAGQTGLTVADFHAHILEGAQRIRDANPTWSGSRCVADAYRKMIIVYCNNGERMGLVVPEYYTCPSCWDTASHEEPPAPGGPTDVPEPGAEPEVVESHPPSSGAAFVSHSWEVSQGSIAPEEYDPPPQIFDLMD